MQAKVPVGTPAVQVPGVRPELLDAEWLVDCAEFDVWLVWEALRAAQAIYKAIAGRPVCAGCILVEPSAN